MIHIATCNIHKGFSQFNRNLAIHDLREQLRKLTPDIVFLQEVQGLHVQHSQRYANWPDQPQHEFIAEDIWADTAYGRNVVRDHRHHGNAILSRFPILSSHNQDVTHLRFERRGLLHSMIEVPGLAQPLHCVCVHLSLLGRSRQLQLDALANHIETVVPRQAPLIIAGDFNDWRNRAHDELAGRLGMIEAFSGHQRRPPRSFPAVLPMFRLDRIYVRGFLVRTVMVHSGRVWSRITDHAALSARLGIVRK
ncbi:putative metal-dependent hydrolase [Georgfuchsia toluolica]|uniref:Metal-dependent hydrolase n=2 Tax=Georgfuchsia toluolica TaxID=424218 RepID=A0A916J4L0_9PROT|nr:endonuclease/exonuclease/phosphatase family protein [Georgfuchsia toluolica]CAG4884554.1 putative metal-dependent hydrolase [Georgfuchsia toluolica]